MCFRHEVMFSALKMGHLRLPVSMSTKPPNLPGFLGCREAQKVRLNEGAAATPEQPWLRALEALRAAKLGAPLRLTKDGGNARVACIYLYMCVYIYMYVCYPPPQGPTLLLSPAHGLCFRWSDVALQTWQSGLMGLALYRLHVVMQDLSCTAPQIFIAVPVFVLSTPDLRD